MRWTRGRVGFPVTKGPSKFLFPKTNVNLLIRGTRTKARIEWKSMRGKRGSRVADRTEGVGGLRLFRMIPDNVQSPAELYTLHIDPKGLVSSKHPSGKVSLFWGVKVWGRFNLVAGNTWGGGHGTHVLWGP